MWDYKFRCTAAVTRRVAVGNVRFLLPQSACSLSPFVVSFVRSVVEDLVPNLPSDYDSQYL